MAWGVIADLTGPPGEDGSDADVSAHEAKARPHTAAPVVVSGTTGSANINAALGRHFRITMGGARTLAATTNAVDGMSIVLEVIQDATGGRVLTLTQDVTQGWSLGGNPVTIDTIAGRKSYITAVYNGPSQRWHILGSRIGFF